MFITTRNTIFRETKNIQDSAFRGCVSIADIRLSDTVEYIHHSAFKDCTSLKELNKPKQLNYDDIKIFESLRIDTWTN